MADYIFRILAIWKSPGWLAETENTGNVSLYSWPLDLLVWIQMLSNVKIINRISFLAESKWVKEDLGYIVKLLPTKYRIWLSVSLVCIQLHFVLRLYFFGWNPNQLTRSSAAAVLLPPIMHSSSKIWIAKEWLNCGTNILFFQQIFTTSKGPSALLRLSNLMPAKRDGWKYCYFWKSVVIWTQLGLLWLEL